VQTAVELAEEHGRHWGLSLSLLLTRVLPAMDRLTDALSQGYWAEILSREGEKRARYEHVVAHATDGIFDVDLDGRIHFVNPALASILGRPAEDLVGVALTEVMRPVDPAGSLASLFRDTSGVTRAATGAEWRRLSTVTVRPDGERRHLVVQAMARQSAGEVVGFQGIVREETGDRPPEHPGTGAGSVTGV
jgi:PAS domain S-box-containing protein